MEKSSSGRRLMLPVAGALYAAAAMSVGPIGAKHILGYLGPYVSMFCFSSLASISLFSILFITGRVPSLSRKNLVHSMRIAAFFLVFQVLPGALWFNVLPQLKGIFAMLLKRTQPLVVLLLSVPLASRRIRIRDLALTLLALCGVHILLADSLVPKPGVFLTGPVLGAALCVLLWGVQFIYARGIFAPFEPMQANAVGMASYSLFILPLACRTGLEKIADLSGAQALPVLLMGIFVFGIGVAAVFWALNHLEAWTVSMIMLTGPVFGAAAAYYVLGETLSLLQVAGAVLVIVSMAMAVTAERSGAA